jgi:hypothetical protein
MGDNHVCPAEVLVGIALHELSFLAAGLVVQGCVNAMMEVRLFLWLWFCAQFSFNIVDSTPLLGSPNGMHVFFENYSS